MLRTVFLALSLALPGWALPASAATPTLVKDINPGPDTAPQHPPVLRDFTSVGARAVFVLNRSDENNFGSELWASDGTDAGTERLASFFNTDARVNVIAGNGRVAFVQVTSFNPSTLTQSFVLWRTDGTPAGTFPLTPPFSSPVQGIVNAGALYFSGCTADSGCEPWASDGTPAGTHRLRDLTPGDYGSGPRGFVAVGPRVYFLADTPVGPGLWQTDGTRRGTRRVAPLPPSSNPSDLTAAGDRLFFLMGPTSGKALWTSDGTPQGTRPVPPFDRSRARGPAASQLLAAVGGLEYFVGFDPVTGWQLYRTDGTSRGTRRLTGFSGAPLYLGVAVPVNGRLLFAGPPDGKLWTSDGTRAGTGPLTGCEGGCPTPTFPYNGLPAIVVSGGLAFFGGYPAGGETEPWVSDGTPAGTRRIADLCQGSCSSSPLFGPVIRGQVLFYAGGNLFGTDGTAAGTHLLALGAIAPTDSPPPSLVAAAGRRLVFAGFAPLPGGGYLPALKSTAGTPESELTLDLGLNGGAPSDPRGFTPLGDGAVFFACAPQGTVWKTGGTPETTVPLADAGQTCTDPTTRFVVLNGVAYFKAIRPGDYWHELWRTDGTPAGTYAVSSLGPAQEVDAVTVLHGKLLMITSFIDNDPTLVHSALWTSDGTAAGTVQVFDFAARYVRELFAVGDAVYFSGQDADYVTGVFRTDGTAAGTVELTKIGSDDQTVSDFQQLGGEVFFLALRRNIDGTLWKTDGTPAGTRQLSPPGNQVTFIQGLAQLGGRLYFIGLDLTDPESGQGLPTLFRSDGTVAGTVRVKAFSQDGSNLIPYFPTPQLTVAGGNLYFVAADPAHGSELWRSDGTAAGTVLVKDIRPGPGSSRISSLTAIGDRVFFAADDGVHGSELWTSDGTAAGTRLVGDLAAGPPSSTPKEMALIGNHLFFSADDGVVGREPWVLSLESALAGRIVP